MGTREVLRKPSSIRGDHNIERLRSLFKIASTLSKQIDEFYQQLLHAQSLLHFISGKTSLRDIFKMLA